MEASSHAIGVFKQTTGIGVKGVAEAIIQLAEISYERILKSYGKSGNLQIDFRKTFNSVKRRHILKAVNEYLPGIAAFTNYYCSHHNPLFYDRFIVGGVSGLQQGNPLDSLMSSFTFLPSVVWIHHSESNLQSDTC